MQQGRETIMAAVQSESRPARPEKTDENQAEEVRNNGHSAAERLCRPFALLFIIHLVLIFALIAFLTVRVLDPQSRVEKFEPNKEYSSLISSILSTMAAAAFLFLTFRSPSKAVPAIIWISPILTVAVSVLFLSLGSVAGLISGALALIFAIIQALYGCWVTPRRNDAVEIMSYAFPRTVGTDNGPGAYVVLIVLVSLIYSCIWILGAGSIVAVSPGFRVMCVIALLLSLAWTMHVLRNVVHVAVSFIGYSHVTGNADVDARTAFAVACTSSFGDICLGSLLTPLFVAFRGFARVMNLLSADADEFLFSCAHCYVAVADRMVLNGNRWGFVHVGAHGKGFVRASSDTWVMFERQRMVELVDKDLTASFCFLCGVAAGGLSSLLCGVWSLAIQTRLATRTYLYASLIGYFLGRIVMACPQASMSAFLVSYAEYPLRFGPAIMDLMRRRQRLDGRV